ncbi:MAG: SulP family inorganic anion transporter [Myxococcota bacterium]|nr:SulP family inorganic anion transporter [Myxococcota bacterium]
MSTPSLFSNVKKDVLAAWNVSIVAVPDAIGVGLIAVAPLGAEYASVGVLAGLYAMIFGTIVPVFTGSSRFQFGSPGPASAGLLAGLMSFFIAHPIMIDVTDNDSERAVQLALSAMLLCTTLSGIAMALIGQLRMGDFIKLVPKTVTTGILNGIVIMIFIYQIPPFLGLPSDASLDVIWTGESSICVWDVFIGSVTLCAIALSRRFWKDAPELMIGLVAGTLSFVLLDLVLEPGSLGATIGAIPARLPDLTAIQGMFSLVQSPAFPVILPEIIVVSGSVVLICSIGVLITAVTADTLTNRRHDATGELRGSGMGNVLSGLFGGIPCGGFPSGVMINYQSGGRTRLSHIVCTLFFLAFLAGLGPLFRIIPISTVAAVLFVMGLKCFDQWTLYLLRNIIRSSDSVMRKRMLIDFSLVTIVSLLLVFSSVLNAIVIGFVGELLKMLADSKSILRGELRGNSIHSNTVRRPSEYEVLEEHGSKIGILQLQGHLFFGNTDFLAERVNELANTSRIIILDFQRVVSVDTSGILILKNIDTMMKGQNVKLLYALAYQRSLRTVMYDMGLRAPEEEWRIYNESNIALANAEDILLEEYARHLIVRDEILLQETIPFHGFSDDEIAHFELKRQTVEKGLLLLEAGTKAMGIYILVKGRVSIIKTHDRTEKAVRLVNLGPGVTLGEMSILGTRERTADVLIETDAVVYFLSNECFEKVSIHHPELALRFVQRLAGSLARRLNEASKTISELSS